MHRKVGLVLRLQIARVPAELPDTMQRVRKEWIGLVLVLLCPLVLGRGGAGFPARPTILPAALRDAAPATAAHVFLRAGCASCERHLEAWRQAQASLPTSIQKTTQQRIRFWEVGPSKDPHDAHRPLPVAARRLGIRHTPQTWWVDHADSITRVWIGARSADAWHRQLTALLPEGTP